MTQQAQPEHIKHRKESNSGIACNGARLEGVFIICFHLGVLACAIHKGVG